MVADWILSVKLYLQSCVASSPQERSHRAHSKHSTQPYAMKACETQPWLLTRFTCFPPDDNRLQLGQILTDPLQPAQPLFPSTLKPPPTMAGMADNKSQVNDVTMDSQSHAARRFSLWANNSSLVPVGAELHTTQMRKASWQWRFDAPRRPNHQLRH